MSSVDQPRPVVCAGTPAHTGTLVRQRLAAQSDVLNADLERLVTTETPSTDPGSLGRGADVLARWVRQRWPGVEVEQVVGDATVAGSPEAATVVRAEIPGSLPGTVVLLGHHDTVFDTGTIEQRPFSIAEQTWEGRTRRVAHGPGVFDMKAGIVLGVHAIAALDAQGIPRPTVRLLINADEEVGSLGSRGVLVKQSEHALGALVLEPGGCTGTLKYARKGVGLWDVNATGIASHAGLDPERGASAIHALADLACHAVSLADPAVGTTVNVGTFSGGGRANVVAPAARLELDVRARTVREAERVEGGLLSWSPADPRVRVTFDGGWNRPPWQATDATHALIRVAEQAVAGWGLSLDLREVGGASDGNVLADAGITVLDGMGASGDGAHAAHEYAVLDDMPERAGLLAAVVAHWPCAG
ncbi:M20/M25/M40 family metallo-hydrolase [Allosaccharopolyspora coralli]|uniref:M20/M25/M40 family metallo-hydrolase n=1 Tax=Allosaccharopolyspora coralli TaxID=2665642 RepID=A0A5Q3Q4M5_9PSEU|nr:M20/M25/M40 family metallo-hydrolase [Allosaccharopolyspora coralli]QGK69571.1 M20/M25/M40 family metallo-hydrolase [Allosaccharopolyspora coralli]